LTVAIREIGSDEKERQRQYWLRVTVDKALEVKVFEL
jgi:hypothetical protein